jgi:hypothetical protein
VRAREFAAAGRSEEFAAALATLFGVRVDDAGHGSPAAERDGTA